jgi:hypothetical protein
MSRLTGSHPSRNGQGNSTTAKARKAKVAKAEPVGTESDPVRTESTPATNADPVINEWDPETYRVSQALPVGAGVQMVLTEIEVRTPDKAWWVQVRPEFCSVNWVIELKDSREIYLVHPSLWSRLVLPREATFKRKVFYLAVTMQGRIFLWHIKMPDDDTKAIDRWSRKPLQAAQQALEKWTRLTWNEETKEHDVHEPPPDVVLPGPHWPDLSMADAMRLAFKDKRIDSWDHPKLRQLRGEIA